jgi:outer membrane lipoprotein-sorting protein
MSVFDRHPRLRWAVPGAAATVLVAGSVLAPLGAVADSGLEPRTAEELLVALQQAEPTPVSGTVVTDADLGLPDLPMGMGGTGAMALASGTTTLRVWTDGPERQRLAMIEERAETTVVRNGAVAWVWSSSDATADRYALPDAETQGHSRLDGDLPPGVSLPSTPQEAAEMALEALDPTTQVTTSGVATVAGRDVYELILTPRAADTLVQRVVLAMDAETMVPLRVQVHSTARVDPAFEVGFTSVDFSAPDPALFEFTPPPGATVTEHPAPDPAAAKESGAPDGGGPDAPEPTVLGDGWSTIVIGELPQQALADLAEDGSRADSDGSPHGWGADDPASTALALLEALPQTEGAWGSGRVLAGTLFSVILTDDGRIAVGAVPPEALDAALADQ